MKKQLIVLSALFIACASQCSMYDNAKASAQRRYEAGKSKLVGLKESAQNKYQLARDRLRGSSQELSQTVNEQAGDESYSTSEQIGDSAYYAE